MASRLPTPSFHQSSRFGRWVQRRALRLRGRRDGKREKPGGNDNDAPELSALKQQGDLDVRLLAAWWHEIDNDLRGRWCGLKDERARLARRVLELEEPVRETHAAYQERVKVRDRLRRQIDALPSELRHRIGPSAYACALGLVFLGEFPLNAIAFRIFGESELLTWIMTTALAVSLVVCAHVLGIQIRSEKRNPIVLAVAVAVPILAVGAIAYVREAYLSTHADENGGLNELPPGAAIVVFAIVNLFVYAAAALLSWARHDPHMRALADADREVKRSEAEWRRRTEELEGARAAVAAVEATLDRIQAEGMGEFRKAKEMARAQKDHYEELMEVYRASNIRARRHSEVVRALEERPEIVIPKELEANDHAWACEESPVVPAHEARVVLAPTRRRVGRRRLRPVR